MKVVVTPHPHVYKQYLKDNNLKPQEAIFVYDSNKLRGLRLKEDDVVLGFEWYKVDDDIEAIIASRIVEKR